MKRILTCALASLICSSAFANEMNRLVISTEANKSGTYTVLKSSMIDSRIHFQKCVSKEKSNFSGNNTLILEDCILVGRLEGYTEDEITSRLSELKSIETREGWIDGALIVVAVGVGGYAGLAAGTGVGVGQARDLSHWGTIALYGAGGTVVGAAAGGGLAVYLLWGDEVDQTSILQQAAKGSRSEAGVIVEVEGLNLANVVSNLNKTLLSLED